MQDEVETATLIIGIKKKEANALEDLVKRREDYLQKIEKAVKDIEGFISKQPNRILQQEAEGYKQREQELFDLAFLLEQSTP
jgi:Skp family chaperone for outer membrane proteins